MVLPPPPEWGSEAETRTGGSVKKCEYEPCGKEFEPAQYHPNQKYCGEPCRQKVHNEKRRKARVPEDQEEFYPEKNHLSTGALLAEVHRRGYYALKADVADQEQHFNVDLKMFDGDKFRFALLGDTHYCSKQQQHTHLSHFYHYAHEVEGITDFFHSGDLFNGDGRQHKGQEFENFIHGEDEQLAYVEAKYPKLPGCKTRIIGGSHDYSFFKSSGSDVIKRLAERREDIEYLGYAGAELHPRE